MPQPDQPFMLTSNQLLQKGRYRILDCLSSEPNFGVYVAYDTVSEAKVVVRETSGITSAAAAGGSSVSSVENLTEISHDALLGVRDHFFETDRQYLVTEPFDGRSLATLLGNGKRPALGDVLAWTNDLLRALEYMHSLAKPLVHGDIRPETICLASNNKVKLLAATMSEADPVARDEKAGGCYQPLEKVWSSLDPTSQKVVAKSLGDDYEPRLRQPIDQRCDLYSLAATIYHVVSGDAPKGALERSIEVLDDNPDPLRPLAEVEPSVPREVSDVIMKALSMKREDRYSSATEMRRALHQATGTESTNAVLGSQEVAADNSQRLAPEEVSLLELEPEIPTAKANASESTKKISASNSSEQLSKGNKADTSAGAEESDFQLSDVESAKRPWLIPAAIGAFVVAALGFWLAMSANTAPNPPAAAATPMSEAQQVSRPAEPGPDKTEPTASNPVITSGNQEATPNPSADKRSVVPTTAQAKEKKPAPAPSAKPVEEKKKVTVDDLINDN